MVEVTICLEVTTDSRKNEGLLVQVDIIVAMEIGVMTFAVIRKLQW